MIAARESLKLSTRVRSVSYVKTYRIKWNAATPM